MISFWIGNVPTAVYMGESQVKVWTCGIEWADLEDNLHCYYIRRPESWYVPKTPSVVCPLCDTELLAYPLAVVSFLLNDLEHIFDHPCPLKSHEVVKFYYGIDHETWRRHQTQLMNTLFERTNLPYELINMIHGYFTANIPR